MRAPVFDVVAFGRMRANPQRGHVAYRGADYVRAREVEQALCARLRRWHRGPYYVYTLKDGRVSGSVTGAGRGWGRS